ncbi:MAG: hypothetical protein H9W81_17825 [Enterococcus sp.]|nr:hypothetical protein [Enterococcus sp.]
MGSGMWSTATYTAATKSKIDTGASFAYDRYARSNGVYEPHESLDPLKVAAKGYIESRDSADHPNSVPIILGLDQTGSMGRVPRTVQTKLKGLFELLLLRGYIEDPQIAISAYGDLYCDPVRSAVQFSNFESDNRIDDALDNLLLYGGGGGNGGETMTGLWYMMTKVESDAWDKRQKKGYAFIVADEIALDLLPEHVKEFAGDGEPTAPLTVKALADRVQEKWNVIILLINNGTARYQQSEKFYTELFGKKNVLVLEEAESVTETIALSLGILEGTLDIADAADDLKSTGSNELVVKDSVEAIQAAGLANLAQGGKVVKANDEVTIGTGRATRL